MICSMSSPRFYPSFCSLLLVVACGDSGGDSDSTASSTTIIPTTTSPSSSTQEPTSSDSETGTETQGSGTETGSTSSGTETTSDTDTTTEGPTSTTEDTTDPSTTDPMPDMGDTTDATTGEPIDECKVGPDGDGMVPCEMEAPPDSFTPVLQWAWNGDGTWRNSIVTPLVANLTDDNDDGEIDLCDIPDVVVVVNEGSCAPARIYVLDGATGTEHFHIDGPVVRAATPALGDIDDDGIPEIIAQTGSGSCSGANVAAYEHDGTLKWETQVNTMRENAVALADLDNDGDVEIIIERVVLDHEGNILWTAPDFSTINWTTTAVADLDGDDDLEVVLGPTAYHHDGSVYYSTNGAVGQPAIGDLDEDGLPEVLVIEEDGFSIYEHDGTLKVPSMNPTGDSDWRRPATIHDLDGDDVAEFAVSSSSNYSSFEGDATKNWSASVLDSSGLASGTAFDFLGDGVAEAIYGDESKLWVFDGQTGAEIFQVPRRSITIVEYPVVVDVDNDGSSEIVVVTNHDDNTPTVQVYRDAEDRWIQSRRIWNQHTYHVTNVREDGTIPQFEKPHWEFLNTFRTNAQIEGGSVCEPPQ